MDARFYNSEDIDIERLASDIVNVYLAQGYQAQYIGNKDQMLVQLKKGGDFEALLGLQAAVSLTLQRTAGGILAMIGQQRWIDKAAVGTVGIAFFPVLWPLALTAGAGAIRQASLGNQVLNVVDGLVRQQRPGIQAGPIPAHIVPQIQQQWGQPPANAIPAPQTPYYIPSGSPAQIASDQPAPQSGLSTSYATTPAPATNQLRCSHCNTPYEPGDTFCSGCGRALAEAKVYCPNCHLELKSGVSFCPKCGASTFSTVSASQQSMPKPGPAASQPPTYTPSAPAPQAPAYQPPAPAPRPQTPAYQPPAQQPTQPAYTPPTPQQPASPPPSQVYYGPSNSQPTVGANPAPKKPEEPYYVPPVTQEPTVKPQPRVNMVQSAPKQEPPPPQKQRPQKQYYIPSNQSQAQVDAASQPTMPAQSVGSINEQPTVQSAFDTVVQWGTLAFSDGTQVPLSGERAVIGRYDHDLGGVQPEVDLGKMQGADTVSRIHAALEQVGSSYMLTDLNSTNATRINGKRLEPDSPTPVSDGDTLQFGKITCTFKQKR